MWLPTRNGWLSSPSNSVSGVARYNLARLNSDGTLDSGFLPSVNSSVVNAVALQPDGKLLVGGSFAVAGEEAKDLIRLNPDGSRDTNFVELVLHAYLVNSVAVEADGQIVRGSYGLARLNADGTLDTSFNPFNGAFSPVNSVTLQSDGKVIFGGDFTVVNGAPRGRLARLNPDGSLDTDFNTSVGANGTVAALALQPDGKVVVGGAFKTFNGVNQNYIVRPRSDPVPVIESIVAQGGDITISWSALAGRNYRVQFKSDLNSSTWDNLAGDITATGSKATKTDLAVSAAERFYRIVLLP